MQEEAKIIEKFCDSLCNSLNIDRSKVKVIDRGLPHKAGKLPEGCMAVYMFKYRDKYLKIGEVGVNSNSRFQYQHYLPDSNGSILAKSILNDKASYEESLTKDSIKEWMENNLHRIDIILDQSLGNFARDVFETTLHYRFNPKYEGRNDNN